VAEKHQVVIIGGGFGGLHVARELRKAPVQVTVIDRRNFHLFQPLLYQVATGGLSPGEIAAPLRTVLKRQRNTRVLLGEVTAINLRGRRVLIGTDSVSYDTLVVAAGARHSYFGNDHWEPLAPGLKTVEDAFEIRRRVLLAFENAEKISDEEERQSWLTFVIVGAGPTGVELAGAIAEMAHETMRGEFRTFRPESARVILVEGLDRVLPLYAPDLSAKAARHLERLRVDVRTGVKVTAINAMGVNVECDGATDFIPARTVLWAAGVQASPLGKALALATGAKLDRAGRLAVEPDFTLPGHPEIFVIGDLASYTHQTGKPLPGIAPVATQQGRYVGRLIAARREGAERHVPPFEYHDRGSLAVIGRNAAVGTLGRTKVSGFIAWVLWLAAHIIYLIGFGNRVLVATRWAMNYFTRGRGARLITGEDGVFMSRESPAAPAPVGDGRTLVG
jgi:NADH:ubiquinone reductase (H+-translocating)